MHEGQVGDVRLYVTARNFKVVDNKMGNVRVDSDLTPGRALYQEVGEQVMREVAILRTGQQTEASRGAA